MLIMLSPAPRKPSTSTSFTQLTDVALRGFSDYRGREWAMDHGVDERALEEYASGACALYEREAIQYVVARCEWAMKKVVEITKARR